MDRDIANERVWYERWYQEHKDSKSRRHREYASYLDRFLHNEEIIVDGMDWRHRLNKTPMPYNVYFMG